MNNRIIFEPDKTKMPRKNIGSVIALNTLLSNVKNKVRNNNYIEAIKEIMQRKNYVTLDYLAIQLEIPYYKILQLKDELKLQGTLINEDTGEVL